MRLTTCISLTVGVMMLMSCDYLQATSGPCREDEFFCQSPYKQKQLLNTLSNDKLLKVSRINYRLFHPPSQDFAREIARRGIAGIALLGTLNVQNEADVDMFRDAARAFRKTRNIDLCRSDQSANINVMCGAISKRA